MRHDRWDPEMRAARQAMDDAAARLPPVLMTEPFGPSRAINERLAMMWGQGGPAMAETTEHWVLARGRRVQCRVHRPRTDARLPVLVWFHGGGWVFQSIDTHDRLVREYAAAADVASVSVDYALAPEARFPQAVLECAEVVSALAGMEWGLDASRIVLGGDSAGGNLALTTALRLRDTGGPALRGILTPYPVTDADFESPSYVEFAEGHGLTTASMQAYWDLYVRDPVDRMNPLAAPLRADPTGLPPTLIQLAELDVLRSDGERMAEKMRAAGVDVTLQTYPGVLHGFVRLTQAVAKARDAVADASAWLRGVMR
ncbi:alpha/beta hydrolase [Limobrevibacterium gyesilva]|uniref:Alpha/beta hydrolase n=1 Tax=Limobrevibacterium gyesilva TaxID=2991712 RepID=A0AA41YRB1_9PROT|nr:alpha/beta hydrolase [Limobrevibacterium gyesilva]MCW3475178.1 alpha/beta hydrolase [Limobrevibacterium gyesilva]